MKWHRTVGGWPIALIALHVVFITIGYAEASHVGFLSQFWAFIMHYPDVLAATVASALMIAAGVTSIPAVRRTMKYQSWWAVHLYLYLAMVLAFAHEIKTGVMFIGHPARDVLLDRNFGRRARGRDRHTNRASPRTEPSSPTANLERARRGSGRVLDHHQGSKHLELRGRGRTVLPVAIPGSRTLVALAPLLAVGACLVLPSFA